MQRRRGARTHELAAGEERDRGSSPCLVVGFETALLFWRAVHEGRLPMPERTNDLRLPPCCEAGYRGIAQLDLRPLGITLTDGGMLACYRDQLITWGPASGGHRDKRPVPVGLGLYPGMLVPLDALTGQPWQRNTYPSVQTHLLSRTLPPGSLYRVSRDVLVVSPELAFVQCCERQRDLPNIELALEFCGTYALMTAGLPCRFGCQPVTSVASLRSFLVQARHTPGSAAARRALTWAVDAMASPRESEVYLIVVLPPQWGGYGLPRPQVNVSVPLRGTRAEALTKASHYEVDLIWPDRRVVLEYDGRDEHEADAETIAADKERRSVLAALGYTVIVITKRDLRSEGSLQTKVAQVALALGCNLPVFDEDAAKAHSTLFTWLFNARHDHLPFGCGYC